MPSGLHGELARAAEREGTSLNSLIIARLADSLQPGAGANEPAEAAARPDGRLLTWLLVANVVAVGLAGLAALVILLVASQ